MFIMSLSSNKVKLENAAKGMKQIDSVLDFFKIIYVNNVNCFNEVTWPRSLF